MFGLPDIGVNNKYFSDIHVFVHVMVVNIHHKHASKDYGLVMLQDLTSSVINFSIHDFLERFYIDK